MIQKRKNSSSKSIFAMELEYPIKSALEANTKE
jgi:hypothetical protein